MNKNEKSKPEDGIKDEHYSENQEPQQIFNLKEETFPIEQDELFKFLVDAPEKKLKRKSTKEELLEEFERLALLGANQITINSIKNFVLFTAKEYKVTFPQVFYREIFRLNGWNVNEAKIYRKPWKVAKYTMEVIYGRFTKEIITAIQIQNPFVIPGIRRHKHFQYLNEVGQQELERFISEAVEVMNESTTWYDFRVKMFDKHKLSYQINLFN